MVISNTAATGVDSTAATLGAVLDATGSVFDVHVCWGTTDGGISDAEWEGTAFVGRVANAVGHGVSYRARGLAALTDYYYTFRASNAATNIWAAPSRAFRTPDPAADNVDTDGDGLPDAWERGALGGTNVTGGAPDEDWDRDGAPDGDEYTAGTQATNPASYFKLDLLNVNDVMIVLFEGLEAAGPGYAGMERRYDLEQTTNLLTGPWLPVAERTNLLGEGKMIMYSNPPIWSGFLRGKVRLKQHVP
jgi:hypothetical protein